MKSGKLSAKGEEKLRLDDVVDPCGCTVYPLDSIRNMNVTHLTLPFIEFYLYA
jgi:hypothetical protein